MNEQLKGYVLILTKKDSESVVRKMKAIPEFISVDTILGPWNVIASYDVANEAALQQILNQIKSYELVMQYQLLRGVQE